MATAYFKKDFFLQAESSAEGKTLFRQAATSLYYLTEIERLAGPQCSTSRPRHVNQAGLGAPNADTEAARNPMIPMRRRKRM